MSDTIVLTPFRLADKDAINLSNSLSILSECDTYFYFLNSSEGINISLSICEIVPIHTRNMMKEMCKIGIDLIEISRFKNIAEKTRFLENNFTKKELKDCKKKPAESLAARFAAKEAIRKTIDENIKFNLIEIINKKTGKPDVNFLDKNVKRKYKSEISISHTQSIAQAVCITFKK